MAQKHPVAAWDPRSRAARTHVSSSCHQYFELSYKVIRGIERHRRERGTRHSHVRDLRPSWGLSERYSPNSLPTPPARPLNQPGPPAEKLDVLVLVPVAVPFSAPAATAARPTRAAVTLRLGSAELLLLGGRRLGRLGQRPGAQVQQPLQVALVAREAGAVLQQRGEEADGGVDLGEDEAGHDVAWVAQHHCPQAQRRIEYVILEQMLASLAEGQEHYSLHPEVPLPGADGGEASVDVGDNADNDLLIMVRIVVVKNELIVYSPHNVLSQYRTKAYILTRRGRHRRALSHSKVDGG